MSDKREIIEKMQQDMLLFGRMVMPNMFSSESPKFHYTITETLQDNNIKQINIIAPRGHAKSSVVAGVYPLFHLMFDKGVKVIVLVSAGVVISFCISTFFMCALVAI